MFPSYSAFLCAVAAAPPRGAATVSCFTAEKRACLIDNVRERTVCLSVKNGCRTDRLRGHHPQTTNTANNGNPGRAMHQTGCRGGLMERRRLGPLEVSIVGLGGNNFGRRLDAQGTVRVVHA